MTALPSEWRNLLDKALPALDHVFGSQSAQSAKPSWTLGGGTAIAIQLDHRVSYDVDLFVPGTALKEFTPARNPAAKAISDTYQWPGHYLKFELPNGEIDFLSPPLQTEPGFSWAKYHDRQIALETPEEVIIKKIRYRSEKFTPRDAYDLAAVALERPNLTALMATETPDALPRLQESLRFLHEKGRSNLAAHVVLTEKGKSIAESAFENAQRVTAEAIFLITPGSSPPQSEIMKFMSARRGGIAD